MLRQLAAELRLKYFASKKPCQEAIPGMSKTHLPFASQKITYLKRKSFQPLLSNFCRFVFLDQHALWQQISGLQAFSGPISLQATESIWVKKACPLICGFHSFHFRGARPPWPVVTNWPFLPPSLHGEDESKTSKLYAPNNKDLTGFRPPICQMLFNHI